MAGIVLAVIVLVTVNQFVVMVFVLAMKLTKHVRLIVMPRVNVVTMNCLTAPMMIAAHYHGLVMDLRTVKTSNMVVI
jgi:hypothetical protein